MQVFADETEALDWLRELRKHGQRLDPTSPRVQEIITEAVRHVGALRFSDKPIERVLIAQASGLTMAAVAALLDETEP